VREQQPVFLFAAVSYSILSFRAAPSLPP